MIVQLGNLWKNRVYTDNKQTLQFVNYTLMIL